MALDPPNAIIDPDSRKLSNLKISSKSQKTLQKPSKNPSKKPSKIDSKISCLCCTSKHAFCAFKRFDDFQGF